jgi:hypothetical protein
MRSESFHHNAEIPNCQAVFHICKKYVWVSVHFTFRLLRLSKKSPNGVFAPIVSGSDRFSASCPERRKKSRKKAETAQKSGDNARLFGYNTRDSAESVFAVFPEETQNGTSPTDLVSLR